MSKVLSTMKKTIELNSIINLSPDGFWVLSKEGKILEVNKKYLDMSGYSREEVLNLSVDDLDSSMSSLEIQEKISQVIQGDNPPFQTTHIRKNGDTYPVEIHTRYDHTAEAIVIFIRNIEHRLLYKHKSIISDEIFNNSVEAIMVTDAQNKIILVNNSFCSITGYSRDEVIGSTPKILQSNRQDKYFYQNFWKSLKEDGKWVGEIWNKRKNGKVYPEWLTISSIYRDGIIENYVAQFSDISDKKNSDEEKYFLAYHDHLTNLPNRALLNERLDMLVDIHQDNELTFAVLFIDLDRFKVINDSLGHETGDEILKILANRIRKVIRSHDTVAKVGGDEFIIIIEGFEAIDYIDQISIKLLQLIEEPIALKYGKFYLTASIGVSIFPDHTEQIRELLSFADIAMYEAKKRGGNRCKLFDSQLRDKAQHRLEIENGMHRAIKNQEFEVWYQPQINIKTNEVYAVECLIRWHHPSLGLVQPNEFIPVAEETGLINNMGEFVIIEAINQLKEWNAKNIFKGMIAINVSGKQLEQEHFVEKLKNIIEISKLPASVIELEVTESAFEEGKIKNIEKLAELRSLGFKIAIDDFGTGYSSLKRIKNLPVDNLKIDKCFIDNITTSEEDESLVKTMLNIAETFKMDVIAEGIETIEQCNKLLSIGVVNNQGYLHSKPLTANDFEIFIKEFNTNKS